MSMHLSSNVPSDRYNEPDELRKPCVVLLIKLIKWILLPLLLVTLTVIIGTRNLRNSHGLRTINAIIDRELKSAMYTGDLDV